MRKWGEETAVSTLTDTPFHTIPIPKAYNRIIQTLLVTIGECVRFISERADVYCVWIVVSLKLGLKLWRLIIYNALDVCLIRKTSDHLPTVLEAFILHLRRAIDMKHLRYWASRIRNVIFQKCNEF